MCSEMLAQLPLCHKEKCMNPCNHHLVRPLARFALTIFTTLVLITASRFSLAQEPTPIPIGPPIAVEIAPNGPDLAGNSNIDWTVLTDLPALPQTVGTTP